MDLVYAAHDASVTVDEIVDWVHGVKNDSTFSSTNVEEFYNACHDRSTGRFCASGTPGARIVRMSKAARIARITRKQGGATISLHGMKSAKSGYAVAARPKSRAVFPATSAGTKQIAKWLKDNAAVLRQPGMHVGTWYDKKTGKLWLDVSKVYPNTPKGRALALRTAGRNKEIAIFHLDSMSEIETRNADKLRQQQATETV